ncbi:MAG: Ig-like domain-containing protein [Byssovorax sp.]
MKHSRSGVVRTAMLLGSLVALWAGCAPATPASPDGPAPGGDTTTAKSRPRGVYQVKKPSSTPSGTEAQLYKDGPPGKRTLFLNRNGGKYTPGDDDSSKNISSVPSFTANVPPYEKGSAAWAKVLACVKDQFSPFNVEVTDVDPGSKVHVEAVFGGMPGDIGMPQGVGGVSPMNGDCSMVEAATVYIFTQVYGDPQEECETAAQEIGHAIGMDHEYLCSDPMTYLSGCGNKKFQDKTVSCGEDAPRDCMCGGKQNSVQFMLNRLGPDGGGSGSSGSGGSGGGSGAGGGSGSGDTVPPKVDVGSPDDGGKLTANSTIVVTATATDDVSLASVALLWQLNGKTITMDCASGPDFVDCAQTGDTFTWKFPVGSGPRSFSVRAVDSAGNQTETPVRSITLADDGGGGQPPPPSGSDPQVSFVSPAAGDKVSSGDSIPVRVTVDDDGWIDQVWLRWKSPTGDAVYALDQYDATTWGIDLDLSSAAQQGDRTLRVTAWDNDGNKTTAPDLTIQVQ